LKIQTNYIKRELHFTDVDCDWKSELLEDNWCLILIANSSDQNLLDEIISDAISNNVGYICGIGKQHDYIHEESDLECVLRDVGESVYEKTKHLVMTTGNENLEEGLWFGLNCTFNDEVEIEKILIVDSDNKWLPTIEELLQRFTEGYIPD